MNVFKKLLLVWVLVIHTLQAAPLDKIVAVVNDDVVLASDVAEMSQRVIQQILQRGGTVPPENVLEKQVLERIILQRIQLQLADRIGIRVGDDILNNAMKQIAANNKMTLREFRNALDNDGIDYQDFRNSIRDEMIISRLRKRLVEDKVVVSDREVDNYLATQAVKGAFQSSYHLAHILVSVPEAASPEQLQQAKEKLEKIQSLLKAGTDFTEVAAGYSDGQNALDGGDLGWRKEGELPSLFAEVVPKLKVGQISEPLRSASGYHLVKLLDKRNEEQHLVKQTLASHILIKTNALTSDEQAKEKLERLRERIINGEDFAELARASSDDTGSAVDGGSLGWVTPGTMVPEFEEKMNALEPGEVSEVFKSRFGWHIIKVFDRREQNMAEEYKRSKARQAIRQRKIAENLESWLRQLRDEAYVEYRDR